jgi:hypothetical protein
MPKIIIDNLNLGGIAYSKYQGIANSVAQMVGFDLHSEPGIIKVNQKLTKESGTTVDDFVKCILPCSDGNTYLFGSTNGKIWKRLSNGTYSLEATASPAAGAAGIIDAIEDQGYVYYSMQSRIGRWQLGTAWSTRNDNWATFTNTDADFHPFQKVNLINYVGDKNYVAQIEDGVFTADALDVKSPLRVKALGINRTRLLLGTYVADNVNASEVFDWNTWSVSFDVADPIPEIGINSFLKTDNEILVNAGQKGNIYRYNGDALIRYKRLNGDWGIGKTAQVHPNASANYNGLPLFGVSNIANNPCLQGVYSFGNYSPDFPAIINLEYVISQAKLASIEIGAIAIVGDVVLVSWKDGTTYGIDKLDASNKYSGAYLDTRIIMPERSIFKRFVKVTVNYRSLPTDTTITVKKSVNHAAFGDALDSVIDTQRKSVYTKTAIADANTMQLRVTTTANANDAPEIENIEIDY